MSSFGPALPASMDEKEEKFENVSAVKTVGASTRQEYVSDEESEDDSYGPALPPGLAGNSGSSPNVVGPMLPPHLMQSNANAESEESDADAEDATADDAGDNTAGEDINGEDDADIAIGPLPPSIAGGATADYSLERRVEARAEKMRQKLAPKKEELQREEWMTALPSNKKSLGLGLTNRQFKGSSSYVKNEDRSVWTDTPADRERKAQEGQSEKEKKKKKSNPDAIPESVRQRNEELRKQTEEYNSLHRGQSLVTMHQKKRKADLEMGIGPKKTVLQPFDPERDMKPEITLSSSARQKVIASSKKLDTRFERSTQGHYL
ncbi:GPALPP motifs-containing protein 1-like isoform X1 [Sycon ciliatum]|uniref:GPALPP motifs-containing protein 1-like isoform X1 n=1 Tax=Sycon ciliatum TaxID=27933 RepID=UPI0031F69E6E